MPRLRRWSSPTAAPCECAQSPTTLVRDLHVREHRLAFTTIQAVFALLVVRSASARLAGYIFKGVHYPITGEVGEPARVPLTCCIDPITLAWRQGRIRS